MRFPTKAAVAGLSLSLTAGTAWAADVCARAPELVALQVAALQQQLMVAALTCDDVSLYNSFVTSYQADLLASDQTLQSFFGRFGEPDGSPAYHAFKTKMANLYSAKSLADKRGFCANARASFAPALKTEKLNLASFALSQPSIVNEPYTNCGDTVAGGSMVARPPGAPAARGPILTAQNNAADGDKPLSVAQAAEAAATAAPAAGSAAAAPPAATTPPTVVRPNPNFNPQRDQTRPPPSRNPYQGLPPSYRDRYAEQRAAQQRAAQAARAPYRDPYDARGYYWPADRYWQFCYTRYGERLPCAEAARRYSSNQFYSRAPYDPWGYSPGR